ncbi:hypothetical protein [Myxococcus sp. CA039A]|uniref:hypothetical protein n=1 Tax=Myxococcus sp. CA039A TaxID=2741737 RepID=UPI00157A9FE6|nr:hypothetical protein [Myxococcus sp. CA039A]NTX54607.1 hypothetical protein [Myxococcus sp. CA039A]
MKSQSYPKRNEPLHVKPYYEKATTKLFHADCRDVVLNPLAGTGVLLVNAQQLGLARSGRGS